MIVTTRQAILVSRTKAINELKGLIVAAPEQLRSGLRGCSLARQLDRIQAMSTQPEGAVEHRMAVLTLQSIAAGVRLLSAQVDELDPELMTLLKQHPAGPALLAEPGVGPVVAAQLLVSWSHRGRVRSEAAFAALSGTAPLEASSGQRTRHRLNRGGDRDLNRALHTVAITRMRCHPETRAYHAKRTAQGKTPSRHPTLSQASPRPPALPTNPSRHTSTADPSRGLTNIGASNGLLRQYVPKGTDLSSHSPGDLAAVAAELNGRPRQTLGWRSPSRALDEAVAMTA
jgi:transposase